MKLLRKKISKDDIVLSFEILGLENAILVFLYDYKRGLGTMAFALPGLNRSISRSTVLVGGRYQLLSRVIAERVATHFMKPTLAFVRLKAKEDESMRCVAELLKSLPSL